ncbi:MAG: hypothetical protein EBR91_08425 [Flavobacteriia bacterium]|nr:hypothetical protein [Flavobacteriia bacterium]
MKWHILTSMFLLSMVKFMFAAAPGAHQEVPFWATVVSIMLGAMISSAFFYFGSEWVIKYTQERKAKKEALLLEKGGVPKGKKNFTRTNKLIIRIKNTFGIYGICFLAPLIITIPLGSIVCAKFYGDQKRTFLIMAIGIMVNAVFLTTIWYGLF